MSAWGGQPCNPYDTERVPRGSSGGSGVAVGGNLVTIGICEQSGASCQGPASRNGIALILTTKGIMPDSGGIGNQWFNDRAGIHARTLADAAKVLDAIKDPGHGYYDPRDPFTAIPRALIPEQPYASFAVSDAALEQDPKPLQGHAHRDPARAHGEADAEPRGDQRPDRPEIKSGAARPARRRARRDERRRATRTTRRSRT